MGDTPRYLLLMGCSARKHQMAGLVPAIERYDGVNYRVLKRAMVLGSWPVTLDVLIISAEFGILHPQMPIPYYDRLMTRERAIELQAQVSADLDPHRRQVKPQYTPASS